MEHIRGKYDIFANYNDSTIRVYQAYNDLIAEEAIELGKFGKLFSLERMTWIKPSFLWMMYRCGWGQKEGQNRILAIDIKRSGFDFMYQNGVLSTFQNDIYHSKDEWKKALKFSDVRIQWDPERDIYGNALPYRSLQMGIRGEMVRKYCFDYIVKITDITDKVQTIKQSITNKTFSQDLLPKEQHYLCSHIEQ